MSVPQLLSRLKESGIGIQPVGDRLKISAPRGSQLPADLLTQLTERKQEILQFLRKVLQRGGYHSIEPAEVKEYYELSPAQKPLYFIQQMAPASTAYNVTAAIPLASGMDGEKLESIFKRLISRHESLRTAFPLVDDRPVQRIHDEVEFEIEYYEAEDFNTPRPLPAHPSQEGNIRHHSSFIETTNHFIRPFDLSHAPLLRVGLLETGAGKSILLVDMHHIVTDGTSQEILTAEFNRLYARETLAPLPLQYKDYSEWRNSEKRKAAVKQQEDYWLKVFAEEPRAAALPYDTPVPLTRDFSGSRVSFQLEEECGKGLKTLAGIFAATPYMVLLAIFNILLAKISSQEDIVVGTPLAARRHIHLKNIIGMFVNTLAMRNYPCGDRSFASFLTEVKKNTLDAYENQEYPFEELVDRMGIERAAGRNPVFDVMFSLQERENGPGTASGKDEPPAGDNENRSEAPVPASAKFDLVLSVVHYRGKSENDRFSFHLDYCTKLFKTGTIDRITGYLKKIAAAVATDPGIRIAGIEILADSEKKKILEDFNDTASEYPRDKTIHELFAEQAARTPGHTALVGQITNPKSQITNKEKPFGPILNAFGGNVSITYNELNRRSDQLAHLLRQKGVAPGIIVGIMIERCIEMIIGILAILKAGGAYLPLNPDYPVERKKYIIDDCNAQILLTNFKEPIDCVSMLIDLDDGDIYKEKKDFQRDYNWDRLAYIMYTSGSTGKPKGVMVEHRNVVRLVINTNYVEFEEGDKILQTGALEFDASTFEIWGALLNGLSLYLVSKDAILNPGKLKDTIGRNGITTMWMTSQLFNQMLEMDIEIFNGVKKLLVGGDIVSPVHVQKVLSRFPGINVINGYGPTENTTFSVCYRIKKGYIKNIPIGKPIANSTAYILDQDFRPVPIGVPGELYVGGDGVSRGYLNNPLMTQDKFIRDPFELHPTGDIAPRLYATGDLSRWLSNGTIEFLGRRDHQVKIRGFRIELGEIENQLMSQKSIKEAVVIAREDSPGVKYLCAFFAAEETIDISTLRKTLSINLPDYMMPSYFMQVDKIPLTPNGKLDRKALPAPGISPGKKYAAPRDELEGKLTTIWAEVLGIKKDIIGVESNFFELGGHSLKATMIIARIHKELNSGIPLVQLFKTPTIRELAKHVAAGKENPDEPVLPVEEKEYYPLSHTQKRIWVLSQVPGASVSFNIPMVQWLEGELDIPSLERTFRELVKRHESLRTIFVAADEEPVQRILSPAEAGFRLEYIDPADLEAGPGTGEDTRELLERESAAPFDLAGGPLLRVILIRREKGKHLIFFNIHHIISDFLSQTVLLNEMFTLYNAFARREENPLKPLPVQYKDYAAWQKGQLEGERLAKHRQYWLNRLQGEPARLELPPDKKRPHVQTYNGTDVNGAIEEELFAKLKAFSEKQNVTLFMTLLTVLNVLFYHYTGQGDIVLGTVIAGREHADLRQQVGCYLNTLVLRTSCDSRDTFTGVLKKVKGVLTGAYQHGAYPFDLLAEDFSGHRDVRRHPFFDVLVDMVNYHPPVHQAQNQDRSINIRGIRGENFAPRKVVAKFDLAVYLLEGPHSMTLRFEYNTDLFERKTIERMVNRFRTVVEMALEKPESPISTLRPGQKHRLSVLKPISRKV